jgi:hypothetical protein
MHEETNALDYSSEQEESSCDEPEECHWDLYSIYEVHDEPPKEQLEYWKKKREANTALFDIGLPEIWQNRVFCLFQIFRSEQSSGKVKRHPFQ